MKKVKKEVTHI